MNINLGQNMTNLKVRRQRFSIGSLVFLLLFGAVFTGVGVFALESNKVDPTWIKATGEVAEATSNTRDGSTTYTPVVRYEVGGLSYKVASSLGSSFYPNIGEEREIAYNPSRPDRSKVVESAGSTWWVYLFPVIGIACLVIAPYAYIRSLRRSGTIKRLMQGGQKVQGILVDIQSGGSNNNGGYKIIVSATDPNGTVQNYVSDAISGVGGLALADFRNNPIPIDVYLDPSNPQNYYVDVADVPNLTPERIAELLKSVAMNKQPATFVDGEKPPTPPVNPTFPPTQM